MKYVWLIRHAKTAAGSPDHDRELNKRGQADGTLMESWLAKHPQPATWLWSSTAARALSTAAYVSRAFNVDVTREAALYLSSPETVLAVVKATPEMSDTCAVVAHNPGLTYAVNLMGDEHAVNNLPTFGCALFEFDAEDWTDLRLGGARLSVLKTPKHLK